MSYPLVLWPVLTDSALKPQLSPLYRPCLDLDRAQGESLAMSAVGLSLPVLACSVGNSSGGARAGNGNTLSPHAGPVPSEVTLSGETSPSGLRPGLQVVEPLPKLVPFQALGRPRGRGLLGHSPPLPHRLSPSGTSLHPISAFGLVSRADGTTERAWFEHRAGKSQWLGDPARYIGCRAAAG